MMVFFWTRLGKVLIWQKFSLMWEPDLNRYNLSKLKKSNCFIYIAIAEHCWVIKLGELKSDQKYFAR